MSPFAEITQTEDKRTKRYKWASAILAFKASKQSWKARLNRKAEEHAETPQIAPQGLSGRSLRRPLWKEFSQSSFFSFLIP